MIFYFSGTGNSKYIAVKLSEYLNTDLKLITDDSIGMSEEDKVDNVIGIVFPVYAWAPPKVVLDFIKNYPLQNVSYLFAVCTCSDEAGNTDLKLEKVLHRKLDAFFTVIMPNNYLIGADVEPINVQQYKLSKAELKIKEIQKLVEDRRTRVYQVERGAAPVFKTQILNRLFNWFFRSTKPFYVTQACISCNQCVNMCPVKNIKRETKLIWSNHCTACFKCVHLCPVRAIEYGNYTVNKGRYKNPYVD